VKAGRKKKEDNAGGPDKVRAENNVVVHSLFLVGLREKVGAGKKHFVSANWWDGG